MFNIWLITVNFSLFWGQNFCWFTGLHGVVFVHIYRLGIIPIRVNFYEGSGLVSSFIKLGGGGFCAPEESL